MKQVFAAVVCLVEKDGKFLIVQETKDWNDGKFNIPGGHLDEAEAIADGALREIEEETGCHAELTGFVGIYQTINTKRDVNVGCPVLLATVTGGQIRTTDEHPEVRWVTAEEFLQLYDEGKFATTFPKQMMQDYLRRGAYPVDVVRTDFV